jgi:hypothetical protein
MASRPAGCVADFLPLLFSFGNVKSVLCTSVLESPVKVQATTVSDFLLRIFKINVAFHVKTIVKRLTSVHHVDVKVYVSTGTLTSHFCLSV